MPAPINDLLAAFEYFVKAQLVANTSLMALVGNNPRTNSPNIYFQVADEGAGELVVIFDYDGPARNHEDMSGDVLFAGATMLVRAVAPRTRSADVRKAARYINTALHRVSANTPDGKVIQCLEENPAVLPAFEENGVLYTHRGGYYEMWVEPPA